MTAADGAKAPAWFRFLPAAFLTLLVVPFQAFWLDFELVRRGLLLILCGVVLALALRQRAWLPPPFAVPGARFLALFLAWLVVTSLVNAGPLSFWDAAFRIAHFTAFFVLLRLGAAYSPAAWLRPLCWLVIGTATFGILQRIGLGFWIDYGTAAEPVSVFGNLNVAAEFIAVAAAATAAAAASGLLTPRLTYPALALAGIYLAVNGSRSGLLAALLALLALAYLLREELRRVALPALTLLLAIGAGSLIHALATVAEPPRPTGAGAVVVDARQNTIKVRREIWHSCLRMGVDAPLFGAGPGQFQVQYPLFRSQDEIELSSEHRQFPTEVGTAHNDWLEILTEGGVPGLVLWVLFCFHLARSVRQGPHALLPLFAFGVLMFVRAPLGNAPAVAVALLLCTAGTASALPQPAAARRRYWQAADLASVLAFVLLGFQPVLGNVCFTGYLRTKAHGLPVDLAPLEHATTFAPFVPAFWQALALERQYAAKDIKALTEALAAAEHALALRPHEPSFLLMRADILRLLGRLPQARLDLETAATLDPGDPLGRVQRSALEFTDGNHEAAISVVWLDPHPRLKELLPKHFADLQKLLPDQKGVWARRYAAEAAFAKALVARDEKNMVRTQQLAKATLDVFMDGGLLYKDSRPWLLVALQALDIDSPGTAEEVAQQVRRSKIEVHAWERALLDEQDLARLRAVPAWADLLK